MRLVQLALLVGAFTLICPLSAGSASQSVDFVISNVSRIDGDGWAAVDLLLINDGPTDEMVTLPDRLEASITAEAVGSIHLERAPGTAPTISVPAKGFARARYRFELPAGHAVDDALVSIPALGTQQVALRRRPASVEQTALVGGSSEPDAHVPSGATVPSASAGEHRAALFGRLSAHEPVYVTYGKVADSEIKAQLSFKYRLAGKDSASALWDEGLYLGYTQLMLWDRAADSEFHDVDYQPEIFYRSRPFSVGSDVEVGFQIGARHESNGRSGPTSRSLNNIYVGPAVRWELGGGYFLRAEPRLTFLVGGRHDNPDIQSYRGVSSLEFQIGQEDGLQLSTNGRFNFSNGRGALVTQLTYPLSRLLGGGPELYLFGENFVGYGESLVDYRRRMTRLRIGLAVVR